MSRTNEVECLTRIKSGYSGKIIKKEFDNSHPLEMLSVLSTASENKKESSFPDFFFDGGIIEHFEVVPSFENKKGSQFRIEVNKKQKETSTFFEKADEHFIKSNIPDKTFSSVSKEDIYECFSYNDFLKSFKRNFDKHIKSLNNSKYTNQTVVFLIEQQGARLGIYEKNEFKKTYLLSKDKNILSFLKPFDGLVNYVIFTVSDSFEIIDMSLIDNMLLTSEDNSDIRCGRYLSITIKNYLKY